MPTGQEMQYVLNIIKEYFPIGQSIHTEAMEELEYFPAEHAKQVDEPMLSV